MLLEYQTTTSTTNEKKHASRQQHAPFVCWQDTGFSQRIGRRMELRGKAIALMVELNYLLNFIVQFTFPIVQDTFGWVPWFGLFRFILVVAIGFVQRFVPEIKGLT
jgi:hypothetical protein